MSGKRPKINIKFRYNKDTGEVEELLIDDNAPLAPEHYHDEVASMIGSWFARETHLEDTGESVYINKRDDTIVDNPITE